MKWLVLLALFSVALAYEFDDGSGTPPEPPTEPPIPRKKGCWEQLADCKRNARGFLEKIKCGKVLAVCLKNKIVDKVGDEPMNDDFNFENLDDGSGTPPEEKGCRDKLKECIANSPGIFGKAKCLKYLKYCLKRVIDKVGDEPMDDDDFEDENLDDGSGTPPEEKGCRDKLKECMENSHGIFGKAKCLKYLKYCLKRVIDKVGDEPMDDDDFEDENLDDGSGTPPEEKGCRDKLKECIANSRGIFGKAKCLKHLKYCLKRVIDKVGDEPLNDEDINEELDDGSGTLPEEKGCKDKVKECLANNHGIFGKAKCLKLLKYCLKRVIDKVGDEPLDDEENDDEFSDEELENIVDSHDEDDDDEENSDEGSGEKPHKKRRRCIRRFRRCRKRSENKLGRWTCRLRMARCVLRRLESKLSGIMGYQS